MMKPVSARGMAWRNWEIHDLLVFVFSKTGTAGDSIRLAGYICVGTEKGGGG